MSESVFHIGLTHFLVVSFLLLAAGIATMLTKRNAIGILIGVELVLNAASINFVAFNHYGWTGRMERETPVLSVAEPMKERFGPRTVEIVRLKRAAAAATQPALATVAAPAAQTEASTPGTSGTPGTGSATQPALGNAEPHAASMTPPSPPAIAATMVYTSTIDGQMFAIFIIVLAAAEAAVALAIFLNFYNNFSSIDVERADEMKG